MGKGREITYNTENTKGAIHKGRPADPGGGGFVESGRSIVILLFYLDARGVGV